MPIEVRVDIEPVSIILNDGSGWEWLPNEIGPSLLEVRDKQSNGVNPNWSNPALPIGQPFGETVQLSS